MEGDFFHILNRGVEKRKIFLDERDYLRFVHNLCDFNDKNIIDISYANRHPSVFHSSALRPPNSAVGVPKRRQKQELVNVLCWCLMPNHPHIYVQDRIGGGASMFSRKLIGGYTSYFNLKNERNGVLFQGKSKIILIKRDAHFFYIPYYIFSNPIEFIEPNWKEKGIKNLKKVLDFLENYKYSSFPYIIGKKNFPEIINKELFYEIYDTNEKKFKKSFIEWLEDFKGNFEKFND